MDDIDSGFGVDKSLNELTNQNDLDVKIIKASNELFETLKMTENCTSCKKDNINEKVYFDKFHKSIDGTENILVELENGKREKDETFDELNGESNKIDDELK